MAIYFEADAAKTLASTHHAQPGVGIVVDRWRRKTHRGPSLQGIHGERSAPQYAAQVLPVGPVRCSVIPVVTPFLDVAVDVEQSPVIGFELPDRVRQAVRVLGVPTIVAQV